MKCPFCQAEDTKVLESRLAQEGLAVRRRRKCEICEGRFTTYEQVEIQMPMVVKRDGRREKYQREKITMGLEKACEKRPISTETIDNVLLQIEKSILELSSGKEISSMEIGKIVMGYLRHLDPVAYVRFASVYRRFQDVDEFVHNLQFDDQDQDLKINLSFLKKEGPESEKQTHS